MDAVRNSLKNCSKAKLDYDRHWNSQCFQNINDSLRVHVTLLHNNNENNEFRPQPQKQVHNTSNANEVDSSKSFFKTDVEKTNDETELLTHDYFVNSRVKQKLESYVENVNAFRRELSEEKEEELKVIRQKYHLEALKKMKHYNEEFDILVEEIKKKEVIINNAESMKHKMKEIENKHRKTVEEERDHYMTKKMNEERENMSRKINEERCALITKTRIAAESIVKNVERLSEDNTQLINDMKLSHSVKQQHNALLMNSNNIEICLTKKVLSEEDVRNVENWKNEMETTMINYEQQLNELQLRQKIASNLEKQMQEEKNNIKNVPKSETGDNISESYVETYIDSTALKSYESLQIFFNDFESRLKPFIKDDSWKSYRTLLQLFIRTNVNAISSHSMDHLRNRIKMLTFLFSGKENEFQGKQISCNKHSEAANFCMYWAAKTFISVSTKQAIPKSVFPIAVVIVILWSRFPQFGKLLLAFLQQKCPYVVPCYPQREADDTETNYLIACGYDYSADGKSLETEESFLNRMRALVRLYGAIVQTNKQGLQPHGINCGWLFIARLLNLEPRPGITAATIHAFLSTAAYRLCATYRKQFFKLLHFIMNDFIPRIEKCSSKDIKKQAVSQLKTLIEEFNRNISTFSALKKPEGLDKLEVIPNNF